MTKLDKILQKLMSDKNLNTAELARAIGILQPVLHRMVSGQTNNPRIDSLLPITKYFGITVNQLVGQSPLPNQDSIIFDNQAIPLLNSWNDIKNYLTNSSEYIPKEVTGELLNNNLYAFVVKDSTMSPRFIEGTILIINSALEPQNGDFVILKIPEIQEPIFKQIFYDGNDIYLKPLNSEFKTIFLDKVSHYKFLGVAIESRTQLKLNKL